MSHAQAQAEHLRAYELWKRSPQWMRFPGGESLQDVALRTTDALRSLWSQHHDGTVVLVAHDSVNRVVLLHALDLPLSAYWRIEQEPCCINELFVDVDGTVKLLRLNDASHLQPR